MRKNAARAKALKGGNPVQQDLSGLEKRLDGLAESLRASKPKETRVVSVQAHSDEVLSAIRELREYVGDLKALIGSLEDVSLRINNMPDYTEKFLMLEAKLDAPKQHVPWRLNVLRMGGPTSPIKAVEAEPVQ